MRQAPQNFSMPPGSKNTSPAQPTSLSTALTRAHLTLEADAGEVVALAVLARHLAKVTAVAHALPTDALATLAAEGLSWLRAAVVLL